MVDPPMVAMNRLLYDLCWEVARGDLVPHKCKPVLESVTFEGGEKDREEMASVLADVIAHMGQDITMPGENRARLVKLAKWLVESSIVPSRFFQERCEEEFLWDSEMIKIKAQDLKTKEVRVNTRLLYQQTKFNLLREESEGYAKLMTLLCEGGLEPQTDNSLTARISVIKSLIGHFDLDPNRVFDIVLDCFELYPDNNIFYRLIPMFPKSHAAQILGFKFQFYQRLEVKASVPSSLYRIAALLIKAESVDLDFIYAHLLPKDDEAYERYDAFVSKRFEEVNKIGKINLAATGKDLMDDEKQDVTVDLYTALDMEGEAVAECVPDIENDQRLGLLVGFLAVDDWYHAHILFERLSNINPVAHIQISEGLLRIIEKAISCAYAAVCQIRIDNFGTLSDETGLADTPAYPSGIIDLPRDLFQMLTAVGPYLYRNTILLQKVCRVLRAYYLSALELSSTNQSKVLDLNSRDPHLRLKEARLRVEEALGMCLLPSLQLIPANPAVGQEIWELLSLLPYEARYRLYGEWEKDDEKFPMVLAARQLAKLDTRRILKRLAKENLKPLGRMVAKLAHSNPMTVLRTIVQQIEAYRDMIVPVVDAFKYLTQVEYDALEYVVIERLAQGGRDKLKDDGLNLSDWLQSLASFWGHLCKKYPSMELRGLFQYLVNQLKRGSGVELVLLQELVQQMANVHYTENMTEEQLDAMAGSETLRYQATLFGLTRNNKALNKSTNRLRDSLLPKDEPKLAIPLLLLIAQHRSMVIINADVPHIKMVSEQFDRCHGTLLQYVDFLSSALTPAVTYAQLIPPLVDLVHKYHLEPEVAFLIYRPVMRLFKSSNELEVYWPLDNYKESGTPQQNEDELSSSSNDFVLDLGVTQNPILWLDLLDTVRSMLPKKAWNSLSPDLYATFWGLTLYDLYVPRNRYESEIAKQHAAIKALEEISDNSSIAITKRKKEKERIQEILERLSTELQKHEDHVVSVRRHLGHEKDKWLSSCSDISKINIEFLQRCIFPRCIFSMQDAIYCSMFVHTLHSLATPFFNMVNHIDVIICKFLHPMICCCTEYEAGRLGRFLYETLRMAYYWKSDESIYERECGSMPGFAVYIRFPDSQRVTFGQFVRVNWKWSAKMTRLLIQCIESSEYMEIRNALIILTKISSVFPVMRKSGLNLEKRVLKIKGDEREDLKVLATGVAAALASRKSSWVTEEEFGMGFIDLKPASSPKKILASNQRKAANGPINESARSQASGNQNHEQAARAKLNDSRLDRGENSLSKSDSSQQLSKVHPMSNGSESQQPLSSSHIQLGSSRPSKITDEHVKALPEETAIKGSLKTGMEAETRPQTKRSILNAAEKPAKQDASKDDVKSGKSNSRSMNQLPATADKDISTHAAEGRQGGNPVSSSAYGNNVITASGKVSSSKVVDGSDDSTVKLQKRPNIGEDPERLTKRKKSDMEGKDGQNLDVKSSDKEKIYDTRASERPGADEQNVSRMLEKQQERSKDKASEKYDKDQKEKIDRAERSRDDVTEKQRDRSMERYGRERSIDRTSERGTDRSTDKSRDERNKDDRSKPRYSESSLHADERFSGQNLPPPPPLPPSFVPQSLTRREEDADRRAASSRHIQRLSPRHDEKEHRRAEESVLVSHDDTKRRRDDDLRDKKRDERDLASAKVDDRDKDKTSTLKDDLDAAAASKRRKLKKDHTSSEAGEYSPVVPPLPLSRATNAAQSFDARERGDSKGQLAQHRTSYNEEQIPRVHNKETSKLPRRDMDQHEREWDDEKRHRTEAKRKHRK